MYEGNEKYIQNVIWTQCKKPHERSRCKWGGNIKMNVKELGYVVANWIQEATWELNGGLLWLT